MRQDEQKREKQRFQGLPALRMWLTLFVHHCNKRLRYLTMLINSLIEKQRAEHLSNTQFAQKLGVSRALWDLVRRGRRGLGEKMLKGIVRAYPDLIPQVILHLQGEDEAKEERGKR